MAKVQRRSKAKRGASLRHRAAREAWWRGCVREWEHSGQSQAAFAKRKAVAYATFNWWKLRILKSRGGPARMAGARSFVRTSRSAVADAKGRGGRGGRGGQASGRGREEQETRAGHKVRGRPGNTRPVFLPVEVKPVVAVVSWSVEVECRNGRVLRLREMLDAGRLSALVDALEAGRRC